MGNDAPSEANLERAAASFDSPAPSFHSQAGANADAQVKAWVAPAKDGRRKLRWALAATVVLGLVLALRMMMERGLSIESQPAGASVFINGRLAGKTPLRVSGLSGGAYSLRIEKEDFTPRTVQVKLGYFTTHLNEPLQRRGTGGLAVAIEPKGAEVLLDGELIGHTPLDLKDVASGSHDLQIRKTNFKPFTQRVEVVAGETQTFKDFALEDIVLAMLQSAIENEKWRVSHYADMGRYLHANNKIKESAGLYAQGLRVAGQPIEFPATATPEERNLEQRLRNEDITRINDEIHKLLAHTGHNQKDMELFARLISEQQNDNTEKNAGEWQWVLAQADNFNRDNKFDQAEKLYRRHIEAAKGMGTVAQAYIGLVSLYLRTQRAPEALKASNDLIALRFGNDAAIARQAANAIYSGSGAFQGKDRAALLKQAESLLRRGLANSQKRSEMSALCKFELANVLVLEDRHEESLPLYQDSIQETQDASTKELRGQRQVEALRKLKRNDEAREVLNLLAKSPRDYISNRAKQDLKELEAAGRGTR